MSQCSQNVHNQSLRASTLPNRLLRAYHPYKRVLHPKQHQQEYFQIPQLEVNLFLEQLAQLPPHLNPPQHEAHHLEPEQPLEQRQPRQPDIDNIPVHRVHELVPIHRGQAQVQRQRRRFMEALQDLFLALLVVLLLIAASHMF
ncbi:hypothetical protein VKT23_009123 [Stygiomarasmius scandens]|uniref:Uncharacterized protein n=1 Tax=Marasmiellus scandens TaxID=2682957 RepID=A0ABR1JFB3_9AGAR